MSFCEPQELAKKSRMLKKTFFFTTFTGLEYIIDIVSDRFKKKKIRSRMV